MKKSIVAVALAAVAFTGGSLLPVRGGSVSDYSCYSKAGIDGGYTGDECRNNQTGQIFRVKNAQKLMDRYNSGLVR